MSEALQPITPKEVRAFIAHHLLQAPYTRALMETYFRTTNPAEWYSDWDHQVPTSIREVYFLGGPNVENVTGHMVVKILLKNRIEEINHNMRSAAGLLEVHCLRPGSNKPSIDVLADGWSDRNNADLILCGEDRIIFKEGYARPWGGLDLAFPQWHPGQRWIWVILQEFDRSTQDIDPKTMDSNLARSLTDY